MPSGWWTPQEDDRLVDLIYDAALDEALWPSVLERVGDRVGAHPGNLIQINVVDGHGFGLTTRTPEDTVSRYFAEWAQRNPVGLVDDPTDYRTGWTPRIMRTEECVDPQVLEKSDYWNEFLVPIGAFHMINIRLALRGDNLTTIGLGRPNHRGAFDDAEINALQPFHRHLLRAERMWRSLGLRQAQFDQFDTLLATSPDALFFLDDHCKLLRWTGAADALLRRGDALRLVGGRLRAEPAGTDAALQAALGIALAAGAPRPVVLPATRGGEGLTLSVARLGGRALAGITGARCLLVSAQPHAAPDPAASLRAAFGLTATEAELALALEAGSDLRAVAARRGVSINTVRNQLSAVFDKTNCRRQQDLVRMLAARRA